MCNVKNDQFFGNSEVLQQTSLFTEIFGDDTTHSLVDNFASTGSNTVVSDFADTMQSLQTIAEQCLPEAWENDNLIATHSSSEETTCHSLNLEPYLKCQFCELSYSDEWSLAEHIKLHTGQSKHLCTLCSKAFTTSSALTKHISTHNLLTNSVDQSKILACDICGKGCSSTALLKAHMKESHANIKNAEKSYVCQICDKRYSQNKFLVLHLRSHTGERPLHCGTCGKSFSLPSSLHKHRLVHNHERKFSCTLCGKSFKQMSNLTVHMRSHTGL
uniref:C2H2-type domain-containing protein n=2 Tax=Photinus pyralis TaxID=7054 RepID=A0A1Y1JRV8_PHOPY